MILTNSKNKVFAWGLVVVVVIFFGGYFLFVFDIGLNSEYFVKSDFNNAFYARMAGDCDKFGSYIVPEYRQEWFDRCLEEKRRDDTVPIGKFEIKEVSMNDDKAFLQVALTRRISRGEDSNYDVNYEMTKIYEKRLFGVFPTSRFVINQAINN